MNPFRWLFRWGAKILEIEKYGITATITESPRAIATISDARPSATLTPSARTIAEIT